MPKQRIRSDKTVAKEGKTKARTAKERENQLINLAIDLAEKQLLDGSARSQVIVHFLRLATTKEQLENEKLRKDLRVADAKIKQLEQSATTDELYAKAIEAVRSYRGFEDDD